MTGLDVSADTINALGNLGIAALMVLAMAAVAVMYLRDRQRSSSGNPSSPNGVRSVVEAQTIHELITAFNRREEVREGFIAQMMESQASIAKSLKGITRDLRALRRDSHAEALKKT